MRKTISYIFALALMACFNANASSVNLVSDADVMQQDLDGLDPIIAFTLMSNSGDETQKDWMNQALEAFYGPGGFDPITEITKLEFEDDDAVDAFWGAPLGTTDSMGGDMHTGSLDLNPDHYLIKIGEGNVSYDTFLYKNVDDLFLATIGLGWLEHFSDFTGNNFDIYRISHISMVPVPAAFWLFGTALIGLIAFTKRQKAA